jgi:hypothetical protein
MICRPIARSAQIMHLSCIEINTISKMIFETMIHSARIVHQSYVKINTISKLTETSFHLADVN